jgi:hypothetical protein
MGCLRAFGTLFDDKLDLLSFIQRLEPHSLDGRVVHKHITACLSLYETVPFVRAEPLDRSSHSLAVVLLSCICFFLLLTNSLLAPMQRAIYRAPVLVG